MVWAAVGKFLATQGAGVGISAGTAWHEQHKSKKAVRELFLRQVVGDNGKVQDGYLGKPTNLLGLTITITPLPASTAWPNRYNVETIDNAEPGNSASRVNTFTFSSNSQGKHAFRDC